MSGQLIERYRFGDCYVFALAAAARTGWRAGALVVEQPNGRGPHIVHAYVIDDLGRYLDAGGVITQEWMREEYLAGQTKRWVSAAFEEFETCGDLFDRLRDCYGDPTGWAELERSFLDPGLERAAQHLAGEPYFTDLFPERVIAPGMSI